MEFSADFTLHCFHETRETFSSSVKILSNEYFSIPISLFVRILMNSGTFQPYLIFPLDNCFTNFFPVNTLRQISLLFCVLDAFCHAHSDPGILTIPIRTLEGCRVVCVFIAPSKAWCYEDVFRARPSCSWS